MIFLGNFYDNKFCVEFVGAGESEWGTRIFTALYSDIYIS
jgi:hypothetical protein